MRRHESKFSLITLEARYIGATNQRYYQALIKTMREKHSKAAN